MTHACEKIDKLEKKKTQTNEKKSHKLVNKIDKNRQSSKKNDKK